MASARNAECQCDVVQEPNEVNRGLKAIFVPQKSTEQYIRESTNVNIEFPGKSKCRESTNMLRLDQAFLSNEATYISTGGSLGNPGASTLTVCTRL